MSRGRQGGTCVHSRGQCFRKEEVVRWCLEVEKREARMNSRPSQGPEALGGLENTDLFQQPFGRRLAANPRREVCFEPTGPRIGHGAAREASWLVASASLLETGVSVN